MRIRKSDVVKPFFGHGMVSMGCCDVVGLTNSPMTFMNWKSGIFPSYLDHFVIVIIDDILVYSKGWMQHARLLRTVLEALCGEQCSVKFNKCEFWLPRVGFLGHVISAEGVNVDP